MLKHLAPPDSKPSRVLILGRSGFVAGHLLRELQRTGSPAQAVGRPEVDLTEPSSVEALYGILRETDTVVITSALTPDKGRDFRTLMKNLRMAEHLCEVFDRRPCAHAIYLSSDAVYDGRQVPIDEASTREPSDLYAVMHTSRELMLESVFVARGIPYCVLRPVALFGPGDTHNSYGPNRFVRNAFEEKAIKLIGEGEERRSHLYIDDAIRLLSACIARRSVGVLNLASSETASFREVAEMVRSACPFATNVEVRPRPTPPSDSPQPHLRRASNPATASLGRPFAIDGLRQSFPDFTFTPLPAAIGSYVSRHAPARRTAG